MSVDNILGKISAVPVNTFDFRKEYCNDTDDTDNKCRNKLGLIAEDFHAIFERGSDKEISGQDVQMALWLATQELIKENEELKNENTNLKSSLDNLESRLSALESKISLK